MNFRFFMKPTNWLALLLLGGSLALLWYVFLGSDSSRIAGEDSASADRDWYAPRDWDEGDDASLNISVFVFRDRNRNGQYDVGDLPMASVAVVLEQPGGDTVARRSNINGYTNFGMHYEDEGADVSLPQENYQFELQVPPGWAVTTANQRQRSKFRHVPGSVSGLVAESPPSVIGLAPDLIVSGRVLTAGDEVPAVKLIGPDQREFVVVPSQEGDFSIPAAPGAWQLQVNNPVSGATVSREFRVRDAPVVLAAIDLDARSIPPMPREVVQDFDELQRSVIDKLPRGNLGLGWDYLLAVDNQQYRGPGYVNSLSSGHAVGYNSSGHPVTVSSGEPGKGFDFVGAYFGVAWPEAEGETLVVEAWRGSQRVGHEEIRLSYLGPVWFQADYRDIDRLTLATGHYWQFVTDDMLFRLPAEGGDMGEDVVLEGIPDMSQTGNGFDFPDDGAMLCGAVAAANSLAWLSGNTASGFQRAMVNALASADYMGIHPILGVGVYGFVRGISRYAKAQWGGYRRLEYAGWREVPGKYRFGKHPTLEWLRSGLTERSAVWLNFGWYQQESDHFQRAGGHWVNLIGYIDGNLVIHDPGPWAGAAGRQHQVTLDTLESGVLEGGTPGLPVAAEGYFKAGPGLPRPDQHALAILDGAVLLSLL